MTDALPPFVERGGDQVVRGPYQQDATDLRAFVLRGDRRRLAALCERLFEAPSRGAVRCRPLGDTVILSFARIRRLRSLDPRDRHHGWTTETDVVFWVPVLLDYEQDGARVRTLAWMIPYIFVDQSCAVITGREVYGFPKAQGRFEIPDDLVSDRPYRVHTLVLDRFTPDAEAREAQVLELRRRGAADPPAAPALGVREAIALALGDAPVDALGAAFGDLPGLLRGELPVLFLRQLRDVAAPTRAAFQEILLAPARTTALRAIRPIAGDFEVELRDTASHPIARELGLRDGTNHVHAALHVDFDFTMELGRTLFVHAPGRAPAAPRKQKLAVLGGGLGSLSAVFEITEQPGWQERFDITVYQMGFRLGGKGASGRNPDAGQRIEEHGLHLWFGFYENAFALMRRCFAAAQRPPGAPLADWRDAFEPHSHVVVQEEIDGRWSPWTMLYPPAPGEPGDGSPPAGPVEWVRRLAAAAARMIETAAAVTRAEPEQRPRGPIALLEHAALAGLLTALRTLQKVTVAAIDDPDLAELLQQSAIARARRHLLAHLERVIERREDARRLWIVIDLQLTILLGIVRDRVLTRGFDAIDDLDFVEWLRRHGVSELTAWSAPIRAGYDLVFGYQGGDVRRPRLAAGVGLYGLLRMIHDYKGAIMWKMRAGMGDVVFAPLYEVLRARGVHFEFFHKVRHLGLVPGDDRIATITLGRQATVRGGGEYRPLVDVQGLPCWPDRPLYDQLVEGGALRAGAIDLESSWAPWEDVETIELREGEHFDAVILGIPPAALRAISGELCERRPEWRAMVDGVATVCTHAFQLWTTPDLGGLGWRSGAETPQGPVVGAYVEPTDTYADMTHLLTFEAWPEEHTPGHIAYFCGPLREPAAYPATSDHDFPRRERERVIGMVDEYLDRDIGRLWPRSVDSAGRFDRDLLVDPRGARGRERLRGQLFKANVEPTDRYTQSLPGTGRLRLRADGSGFANLFLAGDWIDNGFNAGCVEATVMSGMQCARAVTGAAIPIAGEIPRRSGDAAEAAAAEAPRLRLIAGRVLHHLARR